MIFLFFKLKFFKMDSNRTNWLALGAAAIGGMVTGFLWYGVLFQQQWMDGNGITMEGEGATLKMFKNGAPVAVDDVTPMIANFAAMLFYAFIMNWLMKKANANTLNEGVMFGGAIGLMSLVGVYINNMFAMQPSSLSMVDGSYALVAFTVMGAIIGAWQKK